MSAVIGAGVASLLGQTFSGQAAGAYGQRTTVRAVDAGGTAGATSTSAAGQDRGGATALSLSAEARAYLATMASSADATQSAAAREKATAARGWFDAQYARLGIGSALVNGQTAVDFSKQDRATLAVVAAGTAELFSADERQAAGAALQARFDAALMPHAVIARHTGDYAGLYAAAADYLGEAGAEERATTTFTLQSKAVAEGLAAARAVFGRAPATGNANDPVRALLDRTAATPATKPPAGASVATVASAARTMLDAQAARARDAGTELVFDATRQSGQKADFGPFENRTLAAIVQNVGDAFSPEEVRAARAELGQRTRTGLLDAFNKSDGDPMSRNAALLGQYLSMSGEERAVLGFGQDYADGILANHRLLSSLQGLLGGGDGASLLSYI